MKDFKCQTQAIHTLSQSAKQDHHSILIEGVEGCGKTYIAKQYASMLDIAVDDFILVHPNVQSIRETIEGCIGLSHTAIICIENLDLGQLSASYALLKILEEPSANIYIIITCRNSKYIPDTIISRSQCSLVSPPVAEDLVLYGESLDSTQCKILQSDPLWSCIMSFKDIDILFSMSLDQREYMTKFSELLKYDSPVSSIQWDMGHYPDNSETPIEIGLRRILNTTPARNVRLSILRCLKEFGLQRVAKHTALAKCIMECKYGDGR